MVQKLFLVETACKDSQALFMGVVNLSWGTCYAVKDSNNEAVNTIELEDKTSRLLMTNALPLIDFRGLSIAR